MAHESSAIQQGEAIQSPRVEVSERPWESTVSGLPTRYRDDDGV